MTNISKVKVQNGYKNIAMFDYSINFKVFYYVKSSHTPVQNNGVLYGVTGSLAVRALSQ